MNLVGIVLQVLPANFLLSSRCVNWGTLPLRLLYSLVYIAMPNVSEVHIVITNSQFHFALVAFLIATATAPRTLAWKVFDTVVLAIIGVTGPFCFLLLTVLFIFWRKYRERWYLACAGILAVFATVQAVELFRSLGTQRPPTNLGASFPLFLRLLGGRLYVNGVLGGTLGTRLHFPIIVVASIIATAFVVYCVFNANLPLRLFVLFSAILLAGSLARPLITEPTPAWVIMLYRGGANRYWFFPTLAFLWCIVWCATHPVSRPARIFAICASLLLVRGVVRDWRFNAFLDDHFQKYAAEFAAAKEGALVMFPIFPPGWTMRLTKKGSVCRYVPEGRIVTPQSGWIASSVPLHSLSLYLDGSLVATMPPVPTHWSTNLDVLRLSREPHELLLRASEQNGCEANLDVLVLDQYRRIHSPQTR
jgi:hypothetical protein